MYRFKYLLVYISFMILLASCKKYLDVKSDSRLAIPNSAEAFQALLDNNIKMNTAGIYSSEVSADDYYVSEERYATLLDWQKRMYKWNKDYLFPLAGDNDWTAAYDKVYIANVILDGIEDLSENNNTSKTNNIKGQALFIRSFAFLQLITTFSVAYNESTAEKVPGIPLRLTSDLNERLRRSTLKQSIQQVIDDLNEAATLLEIRPSHALRASKPAALALLARAYLYIGNYQLCNQYANSCLQLKNDLLNFNPPYIPNLDARFPFNVSTLMYNNPEIIFASQMGAVIILRNSIAQIDTQLISLYKDGDNRKRVLFARSTAGSNVYSYKGSYLGSATALFDGIATDEVYFMRAESAAQLNKLNDALDDLNTVLSARWDMNTTYENLTANNKEEALQLIRTERRKSLVMRGLRWFDIKRLNAGGAMIAVQRNIEGMNYQIAPNDPRYALPIPESIISINPDIIQNER